ncbi:YlaI family protein [Bacillus sp. 03113]|uniref:YlaI family protein n=1 Tax=Bacillus sp. 03113 TaxID=2578211 RepID=UPI00215C456D|nr:YlaI family protein [Bacillus sp. 03113]
MMKVKCVLCDKIESIDDHSFQAKRLRNRPIHTYMCKECDNRITEKTKKKDNQKHSNIVKISNNEMN